MTCIHLRKLYQLCQEEHLRIGGADLVRFVCHQCGEQEVCPSLLIDEYEQTDHPDANDSQPPPAPEAAK